MRQIIFQEQRVKIHLKRRMTALQEDMVQGSLIDDVHHLDTPGVVKADRGLKQNLAEGQTKLESLLGHLKAAHTSSAKREAGMRKETIGKKVKVLGSRLVQVTPNVRMSTYQAPAQRKKVVR